MILFFFFAFTGTANDLVFLWLLPGSILIVFYLIILWLLHIALPRLKIGTDGKSLYLIDFPGRKASALAESCIRTENHLLIGRSTVPIKQRGLILFDKQLFTALIKPVLTQAPKTNEFALMLRNLRNGDPTTWLGLIAIALILTKEIRF